MDSPFLPLPSRSSRKDYAPNAAGARSPVVSLPPSCSRIRPGDFSPAETGLVLLFPLSTFTDFGRILAEAEGPPRFQLMENPYL